MKGDTYYLNGDAYKYMLRVCENKQSLSVELCKSVRDKTILLDILNKDIYVFQWADGSGIVWYKDDDEYAPYGSIKNFWYIWNKVNKK